MFASSKKPRPSKIASQQLQQYSVYSMSSSASRLPEGDEERAAGSEAITDSILDRQLTEGISMKFRMAKARVLREKYSTKVSLRDAATMLPTSILMQNGMFEYVRTRIQSITISIVDNLRLQFLDLAIGKWIWFTEEHREWKIRCSGPLIARISYGYLVKCRYIKLRDERRYQLELEKKVRHVRSLGVDQRATRIQNQIRRFLALKRVIPMLRRDRAARTVQNFLRSWLRVKKTRREYLLRLRKLSATFSLQRVARGFMGRQRAKNRRMEIHRLHLQRRYETKESTIRFFFEQNGAANRIQLWYKSIGWKHALRRRRKKELWEIKRQQSASLLQSVLRRFVKMLIVHKWRNALEQMKSLRQCSALKIQSLIRRFLTRCRFPEKQRRRFPMKIVHRFDGIAIKKKNMLTKSMNNIASLLGLDDYDVVESKFRADGRTRRYANLFLNIKIGELENFENLNLAAVKIQRLCRVVFARRRRKIAVAERADVMSRRLIRWFRHRCWLQDRDDAAWIIQSGWRARLAWLAPQHQAAGIIQRWYRFKKRSFKRKSRISTIQIFWRHRVFMYRFKRNLKFKRAITEQLTAGAALFEKSNESITAEMIWLGINAKGYVGDSKDELAKFFMTLTPQGMLDMGSVTKVLKECGVVGKGPGMLETQKTDMIFTKVKGPTEKKLDFKRFIEFLYVISALVNLKVEVPVTRKGEEEKTIKTPNLDEATFEILKAVHKFRFYRMSGRPALVVHFVYNYLEKKCASYKKMIVDLKTEGPLQSVKRANITIDKAVKRLQAFFMKRILRMRREKKMNLAAGQGFQVTQFLACYKIQRMIRAALSRRRVVRKAQQSYVKYVNDNGKFYWKHIRTNEVVWKKPKSLRYSDCGAAIKNPTEDNSCVINCSVCEDQNYSTCYCNDCDVPYCSNCFEISHRGGQRKSHLRIDMSMCVQCGFQASTKACDQCQDHFCDSCYDHLHRKGRLAIHTFKWLVDSCESCLRLRARWILALPEDNYTPKHLCSACLSVRTSTISYDWSECCTLAKYTGVTVDQYRENIRQQEVMILMIEKERERKARLREKKKNRAATKIQAFVRSVQCRVAIADFIEERQVFMELREEEMKTRNSLLYKSLGLIGLQPYLRSDTAKERLHKMFPSYLMNIIEESCDGNWSLAFRLIREQEEFEWRRDVEKMHLEGHLHSHPGHGHHARLMRLRQKRVGREQLEIAARKPKRKRRRGKGYVRFHRKAVIARGMAKMEIERKLNEAEEKRRLAIESGEIDENDEHEDLVQARKDAEALLKLAIGEDDKDDANKPKPEPAGIISRLKLEFALMQAQLKHRRAYSKLEEAEYCLPHLKSQFESLEDARLEEMGEDVRAKAKKKKAALPTQVIQHSKMIKEVKLEYSKTQAELQRAEANLCNFVGPRGLQRLVADRRKNGVLMPFKVNVRNMVSYLLVRWCSEGEEYLDPAIGLDVNATVRPEWRLPGGWKAKVVLGDTLIINGIQFKVVKPPKKSKLIVSVEDKSADQTATGGEQLIEGEAVSSSVAALEDGTEKGKKETESNTATPDMDITMLKAKKKIEDEEKRIAEEDEAEDEAEESDDDDSETESVASFPEDEREDRIYVDRPWLLGRMKQLSVYKRVQKPFYSAPFHYAARILHKSLPATKVLQVSAIVSNKSSTLCKFIAGLFDEDSKTAENFRLRAAKLSLLSQKLIKANRHNFRVNSFDFKARRYLWRGLKMAYRGTKTFVKIAYKAIKEAGSEPDLNPYQQWEMSSNKVEMVVEYDIPGKDIVVIGTFKIDLDASVEILREYIGRRFGEKLNTMKLGNSFLFSVRPKDAAESTTLSKDDEGFSFSKDFTTFRIDKETMLGTQICTIVREPGLEDGQFVNIKEFNPEDDELIAVLTGKKSADG